MSGLESFVAGAVSSAVAAMGLGGGGVLIVWLLLSGVGAQKARALNLLLFIPSAVIALAIHWKNGLLKPRKLILPALGGLVGAAAGVALAARIRPEMLSRFFGWFLALLGLWELLKAIKGDK